MKADDQSNERWLGGYDGEELPATGSGAPPESEGDIDSEEQEGIVLEDPWLPPGVYPGEYRGHKIVTNFRGFEDKLHVSYQIVAGDYRGAILRAFFIVTAYASGGFGSRHGSRWTKQMRHLFPDIAKNKPLPPSLLKGHVIQLKVVDVMGPSVSGEDRQPLPKNERWSKVDEMLGIVT